MHLAALMVVRVDYTAYTQNKALFQASSSRKKRIHLVDCTGNIDAAGSAWLVQGTSPFTRAGCLDWLRPVVAKTSVGDEIGHASSGMGMTIRH